LLLLAFLLVLTTNRITVLLSFVAIPLAVIYPFMKRYTYVPQFFLGLAFSWGIPMAFAAETGAIPNIAWLLFIANILWAVIYDTMYAMVDREDDLKVGIKSTAILFDEADKVIIGILQLMFLTVLVIIGIQIHAEIIYYSALVISAVLMLYHQYLIKDRTPDSCFRAFLHNNWLGMTIFGGLFFNYL
jgi:4-hydroxybenzoate polyprenyltransferase